MGASSAAKYQVRHRPVGSEAWSRPDDFPVRDEITVDGLDRDRQYEFEVRAVSACGAASVWVGQNYTVPPPPALPPPTVPTTKPGPDGIDLDWGGGEDGTRGDLTYEIQRAKILGAYADAAALLAAHASGVSGDAYLVASSVYAWDGSGWVDADAVDNPAWTTVAKTKGTTWTDTVLDTDQYTYRLRAIDYAGNASPWVVLGQSEAATISTIEFAQEATDAIAAEVAARIAEDAANAQAIIDEATARASLAVELAVVRAQVGDILEADEWVLTSEYPSGDLVQHEGKLYRALQDVPADTAITDVAYWEVLGNYASLGEAVGATAAQVVVNTATIEQQGDDITAVSQTVAQHAARMPSGTGTLGTDAQITTVESASVSRDNALGVRATAMEVRMPTGTGQLATASALSAQTSRIDNVEGDLTAVSDDLSVVEARMPSGSGTLATEASVTAENQARADGDSANAAAIVQVNARLVVPDNLVSKSFFDDGDPGLWTGSPVVQNTADSAMAPHKILRVTTSAFDAGGVFAATPGEVFDCSLICSMFGATGTGSALPRIQWFDGTGATMSYSNGSQFDRGLGGRTQQFVATAPAGVATGRFGFSFSDSGGGYAYLLAPTVQRRSMASAQNATATQSLTTSVNTLAGKYSADYSMTLDVNGYITGWKFNNDGTTGLFDILANRLRIVAPGSTPKLLFDLTSNLLSLNTDLYMGAGRIISKSGGYMKVLGTGFGSSNQFTEWFGPYSANLATCTEGNAVYYLKINGDAYFGGTLSAGVLKNAATSTQISGAASVETGVFGTNGHAKTVVYSLGYACSGAAGTAPGWSNNTAMSVTLSLQRSYNGGAWTTISTLVVTGTATLVDNGGDAGAARYSYNASIGGSSTFTDNQAGTGTFNYRVVLSSPSNFPLTPPAGNVATQSLSVVSTEQ